jgi:hypothetical protein
MLWVEQAANSALLTDAYPSPLRARHGAAKRGTLGVATRLCTTYETQRKT